MKKESGSNVPHPLEDLVRMDRIPHIWCSGCGTGSVFASCLTAIKQTGIDYRRFTMVSGIGCSGRGAGYINIDSFHTTHGRAIPFASGIKMANPDLKVIVFSGDGDLCAIGGNHFIHAARRNMDLTVICINNFTYGMTGGQVAATTPFGAKSATTSAGNSEAPFNLPLLAYAAGATYVARWTMLHARDLADAIQECDFAQRFFIYRGAFPLPYQLRTAKQGKSSGRLRKYQKNTIVKNGANPAEADIDFDKGVILGKFIEIDKPTCDENYRKMYRPQETADKQLKTG
jgi:2-oxoglutarate/2-oxoacid ferredoxin oxidoreductase subunit beta